MLKYAIASLAVIGLVAGVPTATPAATPHPHAKYKGPSLEGQVKGTVVIVAATKTRLAKIKHVDTCGVVHKVKNVRVNPNGTFQASIKREHVNVDLWSISGRFVRGGTKAKGLIKQVGCTGDDARFRSLKK